MKNYYTDGTTGYSQYDVAIEEIADHMDNNREFDALTTLVKVWGSDKNRRDVRHLVNEWNNTARQDRVKKRELNMKRRLYAFEPLLSVAKLNMDLMYVLEDILQLD